MNPEHMAAAHELLASVDYGSIAAAELLATQLAEVDRLTRELAHRTAQAAGWAKHCTRLESDVERAHELVRSLIAAHDEITVSLAERTRERDAATSLLACHTYLLKADECEDALCEDEECCWCMSVARVYPEEPQP